MSAFSAEMNLHSHPYTEMSGRTLAVHEDLHSAVTIHQHRWPVAESFAVARDQAFQGIFSDSKNDVLPSST